MELDHATHSLKMNKSSDELGLIAELIKYAPDELLQQLLRLFNPVLDTGSCPMTWQKTLFKMMAKKTKAVTLGRLSSKKRFPSDCQCAFVVQDILLYDVGAIGTCVGSRPTRRATWVSGTPAD